MKKMYENLTAEAIRTMLDETVDSYNDSTDKSERIELRVKIDEIVEAYNELSLLTVYTECLAAKKPLVEFAKTYYCNTVSVKYALHNDVKDGVAKSSEVASVNEGEKKMSLTKFLDWVKERNKSITHIKNWKLKTGEARDKIINEWRQFMTSEDGYKISKTAVKKAMQDAFDALVFIKSATGKNAIIADGAIANYVIALAAQVKVNSKDKKPNFSLNFLSGKNWDSLLLDVLHMKVENKTYEVIYGDPVAETKDTKAKVKDKSKAEPKTEATPNAAEAEAEAK